MCSKVSEAYEETTGQNRKREPGNPYFLVLHNFTTHCPLNEGLS